MEQSGEAAARPGAGPPPTHGTPPPKAASRVLPSRLCIKVALALAPLPCSHVPPALTPPRAAGGSLGPSPPPAQGAGEGQEARLGRG